MKNINVLLLFVSVISFSFTSCLDKDYYFEQVKNHYNKQWLKLIGPIPIEHDWSVAQQVKATFDLTHEAEGDQLARIYSHHPLDKKCRLLAQATINGTGEVQFDMLKGYKHVYVRVTNSNQEIKFEGYFMLDGTNLLVNHHSITNRLTSRLVSDGRSWIENDSVEVPDTRRNGQNEYMELKDSGNIEFIEMGHLHYFKNNKHFSRVRINFIDSIYPIIHNANSQDAIFQETKDNRAKATQGVEYITQNPTEIALTYVFGATGFYNSFGYFYWHEDQIYSQAHKIILINDARPQNNIRYSNNATTWNDATTFGGGSNFGNLISHGTESWNPNPTDSAKQTGIKPTYIFGTQYKLAYYGRNYDQEATYTFPKGVHVGFFIYNNYFTKGSDGNLGNYAYDISDAPMTSSNELYHKTLVYSVPEYNADIKEYYNYRFLEQKGDTITGANGYGEVSAVTYQYRGKTFLGFEDGIDKDMNDILMIVDADVQTDQGVIEDIEAESYIIACEDLGNTGDYDFNDVVFKVSHIGGSDTMYVTPLASGGTLPVELYYNDKNISTYKTAQSELDFHVLIDSSTQMDQNSYTPYKPLNVFKGQRITPGETIAIPVDKNYTINKNEFTVKVNKGYGTTVNIEQGSIYIDKNMKDSVYNKAPQMLILPGNWNWPTENTLILDAYPDFAKWTREEATAFWYNNKKAEHLVDYNEEEEEEEEGEGEGSGGEGETPSEPAYQSVNIPVIVKNDQGNVIHNQSLGTYKHNSYHNEVLNIPQEWFSNRGSILTIKAKQGGNLTLSACIGNDFTMGVSDNGILEATVLRCNLTIEENQVPLRLWCEASQIGSIEITHYASPIIPEDYIIYDNYENGQQFSSLWGSSDATVSIVTENGNKVLRYTNTEAVNDWQSELAYYVGEKVTKGNLYMLKFKIKGTTYGSFSGGFRPSDQGSFRNANITTEWQSVEIPILCTGSDSVKVEHLLFDLGHYVGNIWFDDLTLEELGTETEPLIQTHVPSWIDTSEGTSTATVKLWSLVNNSPKEYDYSVQAKYESKEMFQPNTEYRLSLTARGTSNGEITAFLQRDDFTTVSNIPKISITQQSQHYDLTLQTNDSLNANRLMFNIGHYTGTLTIEDLKLSYTNSEGDEIVVASNTVSDQTATNSWGHDGQSITEVQQVNKPNSGNRQFRYNLSGVTGNQYYKVSLKVKGDHTGSMNVFLQRYNDGNWYGSEEKTIPIGNGDFQEITLYIKTNNEEMIGENYLLFNVNNYTGSIYFYDLKLTPLQ